jgi:hypothetical protein
MAPDMVLNTLNSSILARMKIRINISHFRWQHSKVRIPILPKMTDEHEDDDYDKLRGQSV